MADDIRPVGFTGTRRGMTGAQRVTLRELLQIQWLGPGTTLHHGGVTGEDRHGSWAGAKGADRQAAMLAQSLGYRTLMHLPTGHDPADYIARNHAIVDACDELIATPGGTREELRSGTWATVRYARKIRRMTTIIWPDGSISFEPGGSGMRPP